MKLRPSESYREIAVTYSDGTVITRVPGPPCACDHCGVGESFWRYEARRPGASAVEFEGVYCTMLCRDRAARHRDEVRPTDRPTKL